MNIDVILIIAGWIFIASSLVILIPKNKIREAQVVFLFIQCITWVLGLLVAQFSLIEYPARSFFPHASTTSFSFEYFVYPSIYTIFTFKYPEKKSVFIQFMYYFYCCTTLTVTEVIAEKYTNLLKYINWDWYISWIAPLKKEINKPDFYKITH
ncbi:hypothetical protein LGK95_19455 [Clostridium algoriphilum]|uniref:CBO0543 family protein n=1 Tax=Clostridium algoriphilum TaxID=198347 RepID=UPI001CF4DC45|nr:CBO0543 family protein [Clostridium algoriphilum]MCB2295656.1 hypothetical protein [Clostridium algoriphilum]